MKLSVKIAVSIFFTLHISALFAEADYNVFCRDKKTLNSAQIAFENQNYGEALKLAEEAKQIRKERNRYEISLLENSFKPAEVKYAGDSLADTLKVLADRQDYDAIEIFSLIAGDALLASEKDTILSKLKEIITTYKFYMNTCIQTEAA